MMLPTHGIVGMAFALPYAVAVPELGSVVLVAGFLGGILPDLDMYVGHRKTLHYPVYFSALASMLIPLAVVTSEAVFVATAFFLASAAIHSLMDVVGGGLELRPWEGTSNRAVYDHYHDRWIGPRRWIRYDGAPEDLVLSVVLAVPLVVTLDGVLELLVLVSLAIAILYTVIRRSLPAIAERLVETLLTTQLSRVSLAYVPHRYVENQSPKHIEAIDEK